MKRLAFAAFAIASAASCAAGGCPSWISVMPIREDRAEELAADAADLGDTTFIDGIVWSCSVCPSGDPPDDKGAICVAAWNKVAPLVRAKSSVKQGILLQSTMGHGGFPGLPTPWQLTVKPDGSSVYRLCPMDERFLAYVARTCREFSDAGTDFFMVDDDTRVVFDDTAPGCFCPLHLAEFAKRTGRACTREETVAMLRRGDSADARVWVGTKRRPRSLRTGSGVFATKSTLNPGAAASTSYGPVISSWVSPSNKRILTCTTMLLRRTEPPA